MSGGIGFYVHHHGQGHVNRTRQIVSHIDGPVTVFGSSVNYLQDLGDDRVTIVRLPSDLANVSQEDHDKPEVFHYAPLGVSGIRQRMFLLAEWARANNPSLLVVDVSVEIALFARLLSVPTVIMRQNGQRNDLPHQAAYQSSSGLLAPYSAALEEKDTLAWVRDKTYYAGGFSRYAQRSLTPAKARRQLKMRSNQPYVVVMNGLGGKGNPLISIRQAAQKCPAWNWWVVGPTLIDQQELPENVNMVGRVEDTFLYLKGADVVVASAGNNTVMEIAAAGTPYICIPEERPFREQESKAEALSRMNAALVLPYWPEPTQWPGLLERAKQTNTQALTTIVDPNGARKCAQYIMQIANAKCKHTANR